MDFFARLLVSLDSRLWTLRDCLVYNLLECFVRLWILPGWFDPLFWEDLPASLPAFGV